MIKKRISASVIVKSNRVVQSISYRKYLPIGSIEPVVENLDRWGVDEIIIFDILGREIFNKKLNNLRAGKHQFIWEGVNNIGNQVSSGVYIIQTKSGIN